jgi:phosphatidate cytidylyltransferase
MGSVLVALAVGVLVVDRRLEPWFPFLFVLLSALALVACYELLQLLDPARRPPGWLCYPAVVALIAANWAGHVGPRLNLDSWEAVQSVFAAVVLTAFLAEMAGFRAPGGAVVRVALAVWVAAYLGLLPGFLARLRWLGGDVDRGTLALALTIFVPKCCDIGAYFTGRLIGRHRMTPVLSPKKTWEGLAGGLAAAAAVAFGLNRLGPLLSDAAAVGFGLTVGGAGVLGDLAESLIKRDCQKKDASQVVPGFGGVLDVVDAVLFAAPVAYGWLAYY